MSYARWICVWRDAAHSTTTNHARQQLKLTRAHLLVHQLRRVSIRHQRHQTFRTIERFDVRRARVVVSLAELIDRRERQRPSLKPLTQIEVTLVPVWRESRQVRL